MSEITILCQNCKQDILRTDSENISLPLIGSMFKVKPFMEWSIFDGSAIGNDLVCPMCGWCFHDNGKLLTVNGILNLSEKKTPIVIEPEDVIEEKIITQILPKKKGWPKGKPRGKKVA